MSIRWLVLLSGLLVISGCLYHTQERADQKLCEVAAHPFDLAPAEQSEPLPTPSKATPSSEHSSAPVPEVATDIQTTVLMQADKDTKLTEITSKLKLPEDMPGTEAPLIQLPKDPEERRAVIRKLYPPLPHLPEAPTPQPGPDGQPYTLAQLQNIAAANSPTLRQAAANVEQARGTMLQAGAYPNPTMGYVYGPSSDASTPGLQGPFIDQVVQTNGKIKLAQAAAQKDLDSAELALKRARSNLSTAVRNAYFALLVAKETVRVNLTLSRFTDQVYLIQEDLLENGFAAPYEPAALLGQSYTNRLAFKQALDTYVFAWKTLVATIGLHQLPLSEVAGRVDRAIPFYDYDKVLAHVLKHHTDMLTAYNGVDKARYLLKAAQVTPIPNVDLNIQLLKEYAIAPKQITPSVTVSMPIPVWDQNKGGIIAAEAALMAATEEPHRVELFWTNALATAYSNYKSNLEGLEYYRKFILPDQVRTYRGIYERRRIDPNSAFGDLVQAQQTLASNVQSYLTILGSLWTSVVTVADMLETDDLFQLATPHELPELPDLDRLPLWMCEHPHCHVAEAPAVAPCPSSGPGDSKPSGPADAPAVPAPPPMPQAAENLPATRRGS